MWKKIKKRILNKKEKGFTLVETLIAISILMISVAAPLSLAAKGIQAANLAKQQIVAYYLAQDAYEYIKNVTDSNKLNDTGNVNGIIEGGLDDKCVSDKCRIDTLTGRVDVWHPNYRVGYDSSENIYGFDESHGLSFENTIYSRYIEIEKSRYDLISGTLDEIKVLVTIKWNIPYIGQQEYTLEGHITNW